MKRYIVTIEIKTSKKNVAELVAAGLKIVFKNFKIMNTQRRFGKTDEEFEGED